MQIHHSGNCFYLTVPLHMTIRDLVLAAGEDPNSAVALDQCSNMLASCLFLSELHADYICIFGQ